MRFWYILCHEVKLCQLQAVDHERFVIHSVSGSKSLEISSPWPRDVKNCIFDTSYVTMCNFVNFKRLTTRCEKLHFWYSLCHDVKLSSVWPWNMEICIFWHIPCMSQSKTLQISSVSPQDVENCVFDTFCITKWNFPNFKR